MQLPRMFPPVALAAFNLQTMHLHEDPRYTPQPRVMGQETGSLPENIDREILQRSYPSSDRQAHNKLHKIEKRSRDNQYMEQNIRERVHRTGLKRQFDRREGHQHSCCHDTQRDSTDTSQQCSKICKSGAKQSATEGQPVQNSNYSGRQLDPNKYGADDSDSRHDDCNALEVVAQACEEAIQSDGAREGQICVPQNLTSNLWIAASRLSGKFTVKKFLMPEGYYKVEHTPGLWQYKWRPISFTLVVDNF